MSIEPRRVEIVGVAGTGKSTLTRALVEHVPTCRVADSLHTRQPAHWPYVAHGLPSALSLMARTTRSRQPLSWDEIKFVLYLFEWGRYLDAQPGLQAGITVLDQGPLFGLARLLWGGNPATRTPHFRAWLTGMVADWSRALGLVVWLDATDDVLVERIDRRQQRHEAKGRAREEALGLLERHRDAYGRVLDEVLRLGRLPVHRLDTSELSEDELVREVVVIFEEAEWLTNRDQALNVR